MKKKLAAALVLVASLSIVTACSASAEPEAGPSASASAPASPGAEANAPTPDLSGVPDVVATVNGEKIPKADFIRIYEGQFQQVVLQAQMSGQELDQAQLRKQTAEGLVSTELLIQEAARKKIFATQKDQERALADVAKDNNMDSDEFLKSMEAQGIDEESVRAQLRTQLEVERLIANELGDFKPTEAELKAAYDVFLQRQKAKGTPANTEIPKFDQVKDELSGQLELQKEAAAVKTYVEKLRKDADVTMNM